MPSKMHSFTRFLRSESSHFRRKVVAKLLRDENVPSQLRNIASLLNDPYPIFRFLQVFLIGVFIAMTVMAWFLSSMHAHPSVGTISNDLQGYQRNNMKLNMASILESTIVLLLVVVIPHKGVWAHITTSSLRIWTLLVSPSITMFTVTITFVCFLTQAATKMLQLCATLIQQLKRMNNNRSSAFAQESVGKELWVTGEEGQLQQRLSNLLSNALQLTAEGQAALCFWTKQGVPRKSVPTNLQDSCFRTFRKSFKDTYICRQINAYFDAEGEDNYILEISGRKSKCDSQLIELRTQPRCSPMFTKGDEDGVLKIIGKNQRIGWKNLLSGRTILVAKDNMVLQQIAKPLLKEPSACADCVDKDVDAVHLVREHFQNSQGSALSKEYPSSSCEAKKALHALKGLARLQDLTQGEPVQKQVAITPHCIESSVDEIRKKERRQEATSKCERARSYALTHQWQPHSRINCKKSSEPKSNRTHTGCKSLERPRATHPWEMKRLLDQVKVDGYKSISSNNSTMSRAHGGSHLVGNGKECAIGSDSQSERNSSLISLLKARVHQKYSSIQPKANQEAKVRRHF